MAQRKAAKEKLFGNKISNTNQQQYLRQISHRVDKLRIQTYYELIQHDSYETKFSKKIAKVHVSQLDSSTLINPLIRIQEVKITFLPTFMKINLSSVLNSFIFHLVIDSWYIIKFS